MSDVAIRVENLSKRYRRGLPSGQDRLTEVASNLGRRLLALPRQWLRRGPAPTAAAPAERVGDFWALKDVAFEVRQGEVVGIIGRNGAGKSTLLKVLSRITEPTSGRFGVRGRVASLLEVGTGFHPELTGRENVFLNGTILGMSRREIQKRFEAIAAFAGIEPFLDTPVKRFSSGMSVRLGFAVAAHLDPDILIIDEALAVGDAAFQAKCLEKIKSVASTGRTVLLVSHNLVALRTLCGRCLWLDAGQVRRHGDTSIVCPEYLQSTVADEAGAAGTESITAEFQGPIGVEEIRITRACVYAADGAPGDPIAMTSAVVVELEIEQRPSPRVFTATLWFETESGEIAFGSGLGEKDPEKRLTAGRLVARCHIPPNLLNAGNLYVSALLVADGTEIVFKKDRLLRIIVHDLEARWSGWLGKRVGIVRPQLSWTVQAIAADAGMEGARGGEE